MPDTITQGPEELLAKLLALAQMKREPNNTGQCGEPGDSCFQLFAPKMYIATTGNPAVDTAMRNLRDNLMNTWNIGAGRVVTAADAAFGGRWELEWTFQEDGIALIVTKPTSG